MTSDDMEQLERVADAARANGEAHDATAKPSWWRQAWEWFKGFWL